MDTSDVQEEAVQQQEEVVHDDGVFTVRIGPSTSQAAGTVLIATSTLR